ncbi:hypothetical protein DL98DRAFT_637566 [Cadophora sp. DSE1049]|nr:hypothetical protein DL98DRAFT_637566 [Cadophora sp. DSE1049]
MSRVEAIGCSDIGKAEVQAVMRIPPQLHVERIDSSVRTSPNHNTHCRLYHTPNLLASMIEHPGPTPVPPSAPRRLRRRTKTDTEKSQRSLIKHYNTRVARYDTGLGAFKSQKETWEAQYKEYVGSLNLESIDLVDDDEDAAEEAEKLRKESAQTDLIAAAKPLVVFTHGRNSTLEDAHITAFCQGFGREAPILLFEDTRPELRRIHVFRTLVDSYPSIKAFSGRSAGARNAAKASIRDLNYRETHLREVLHRMRAKSWWIKLIKGDHSFEQWTEDEMENTLDIVGQIAAIWAKEENLDPDLSEMVLKSKIETGQAEWTAWQAPAPGTPKPGAFFTVTAEGGETATGARSFAFSIPPVEPRWTGNRDK